MKTESGAREVADSLRKECSNPDVAIVIPALNEENTIYSVVQGFREAAAACGMCAQVIVIDDHSIDGTAEMAELAGAAVIEPASSAGLASAFRAGLSEVNRLGIPLIVHADADGQYAPEDLAALLRAKASGADLVVGNRLTSRPKGMTRERYWGNVLLSRLISLIAGVSIPDSQSGYRIFDLRLAGEVVIAGDFTYTQEQLVKAARSGYSIAFVPVTFRPREHGTSRLVKSTFSYIARLIPVLFSLLAGRRRRRSSRRSGVHC
ncbi:glycosyltransferase family 2 protein [Streptomyces sp. NPDC047990]|uniref:glycosyltransferase family 2 protein n=1 Tax=Streptomyces sp. NPDC047990 TaxID=3365496 RepID=UPI0037151DB4